MARRDPHPRPPHRQRHRRCRRHSGVRAGECADLVIRLWTPAVPCSMD